MDDNSERQRRLDEVLAEYLRRMDSGEFIDRDAFLSQHADLREEILAFLQDSSAFRRAATQEDTVHYEHAKTRGRSRGLQIRCPHCSNHVELLVDTPYEVITCSVCGSKFSLVDREAATRLATPLKSIGRFELVARLGIGAFGSVWKARDAELDRVVAVKIPRKDQLSPTEIEQFFREARAAAQLRHPNIVAVHEVGREGDVIYIVCDLVRGVELSDWLTAQRPNGRETAEVCRKIALALQHAHEQKVIHRDLKPSNIMIDLDGQPQLMDFGLAKREVDEITMTVDGQILGTPAYMSPEQAGGLSHWTDCRTDVYSLGVILFRMLTGDLPFRGNAQMQVYQRLKNDPPDPRTLNKHIPRDLSTICLKCLERDPNRRYATAKALAEDLERYLDGKPILARPLSRPARLLRWAKRKPAVATAGALVAILAIFGPLTAVVIDAQNRRLEELVGEKDNLIDRYARDRKIDADEIARLTTGLDLWEGRTNPWKFWPPSSDNPPRRQLLQNLFDERYETVSQLIRGGGYSDWQLACGQLALAMLAEEAKPPAAALPHLEAAKDLLTALVDERPGDEATLSALADCYERLAGLHGDKSRERDRYLAEASKIYDQLAGSAANANKYRADRFETELRSATAGGYELAQPHLDEVTRLHEQLEANWPDDPVQLYDLVCHLLRQEAILTRSAQQGGD